MFGDKERWRYETIQEIESNIRETVVPRIEAALSDSVRSDCPSRCLCHNPTPRRIAELVNSFHDGTSWTDAVYVLECKQRTSTPKVAREEFQLQNEAKWIRRAQQKERLLYVGVSVNVVKRLKEHSYAKGSGANFTQIFPATRLLSIDWYRSRSLAYKAEPITADIIDEVIDDQIYVAQPG